MRDLNFERIVKLGMGDLDLIKAAALVTREGEVVALAGDLLEQEALPLVASLMPRMQDHSDRLFAGEILDLSEPREIVVAVARRQLYLVAITRDTSDAAIQQVRDLRDHAAETLARSPLKEDPVVIWNPGGDGSGIGPANLPLIEYSFDAVRPRAKA